MVSTLTLLVPTLAAQSMYTWPALKSPFFVDLDDFFGSAPYYPDTSLTTRLSASRNTGWLATNEAYLYKIRLPELEAESVTAEMSADSSSIKIIGKRAFDGCTCEPRQATEISLPYRPRPEDVDVSYEDSILTLKLTRHAKASEAVPLKVNLKEAVADQKTPSASSTSESAEPRATRPLRFVPHESATASTTEPTTDKSVDTGVEAQEKGLMDKFRLTGRVAGAMVSSSAEEQDGTSTPPTAPTAGADAGDGSGTPEASTPEAHKSAGSV